MNNLIFNWYFWIRELGLLMASISSFLLVICITKLSKRKRPLWYNAIKWGIGVNAAYMFFHPFVKPELYGGVDNSFMYHFLIGTFLTVNLFVCLYGPPTRSQRYTPERKRTVLLINSLFAGGLLIGLCAMGFGAFKLTLDQTNKLQENYILIQGARYQVNPAIRKEFGILYGKLKTDSLLFVKQNAKLEEYQRQLLIYQQRQTQDAQQQKELTQQNNLLLQKIILLEQKAQERDRKYNRYSYEDYE